LHVTPNDAVPEALRQYARAEHLDQRPEDLWKSVSEELLRRANEHVQEAAPAVPELRIEQRHGEAADGVLDAAHDMSVDLIVVGSRGLSRLSGLVLGSVSQKLAAADNEIDLLIVK
jgi:nucleotide-binding universal stress UspA family protein